MKKVAIVGVEGSGKTVMLAGLGDLYTNPDEEGLYLSPKNYETATYVSEKIARMRKGEWPTATAEDVLQGLDWTLCQRQWKGQRPKELCAVSCLDFAGEVYRYAFVRQEAPPADLADEIRALKDYVRAADDLVVLINLRDVIVHGDRDVRVQEAMWITNSILSYALDERDDRRMPRAAIVLSQADSYADTIRSCGGPKGVLKKYLPHVANNYDWLDVLAVSAVDRTVLDGNGNMVPAPDFQPTPLRVLMHWILRGLEAPGPQAGRTRASRPKMAVADGGKRSGVETRQAVLAALVVGLAVAGVAAWGFYRQHARNSAERTRLEARLDASEAKVRELERDVSSLQNEVSVREVEKNSVKGQLRKSQSEAASLRTEVSAEKTGKETAEGQLRKANGDVAGLKGRVAELEQELKTVAEDRDKAQKLVQQLLERLRAQTSGGRLTAGDKGKVAAVPKSDSRKKDFLIIEFDDAALDELLGPARTRAVTPHEMLVVRGRGAFARVIGKVRLRDWRQGTRFVVAEILRDWLQEPIEVGDVVRPD